MIHPLQVRPEEPIAVTPHDGIYGGESQQWLSYPTNPHVRFDEREWETELRRMAQATAPIPESTVLRGDLEPSWWRSRRTRPRSSSRVTSGSCASPTGVAPRASITRCAARLTGSPPPRGR